MTNNDHTIIPNVMPDALTEPITDTELIVGKLQYNGELNKHAETDLSHAHKHNEVQK